MPEIRTRSSRRPASEKRSMRGWVFRRRRVLMGVIRVAKTLLYLWYIWRRFRDDLWPFYVGMTGVIDATRSASLGAGIPRH